MSANIAIQFSTLILQCIQQQCNLVHKSVCDSVMVCVCDGVRVYREVVPEQLHDQRAVFVRLFLKCIQFCDSVIKCLQVWGMIM